jgi:hypothetical protein
MLTKHRFIFVARRATLYEGRKMYEKLCDLHIQPSIVKAVNSRRGVHQ